MRQTARYPKYPFYVFRLPVLLLPAFDGAKGVPTGMANRVGQAEATMKHAGRVVVTARRVITDEGKTLVISYKEDNAEHPVDNELVCDKQ